MRRWPIGVALVLSWVLAPGLFAQSFNIDIDTAGPPGAGVPSSTFGAAASTPGTWMAMSATSLLATPLIGLDGSASTVTFTRTGNASAFSAANANVTGDYAKLLLDAQNIAIGASSTITITGLAPGSYVFYTYAIAPDLTSLRTLVSISPSSDAQQSVGGVMPVNAFVLGVTHALHHVTVTSATPSVAITLSGATGQNGTFSGLQIQQTSTSRLYVNPAAPSGGNGLSWATAFQTIDAASAAAPAMITATGSFGSFQIWVAAGTYLPVMPSGRAATFALAPGVQYYGGFAGTENSLTQRGTSASTILSGDIGVAGYPGDNAYNVVTASGFPAPLDVTATALDGFTITNGNSNPSGGCSLGGGAGINVSSAALTVRNCVISQNRTSCQGGGVWVDSGSVRFQNTIFIGNSAQTGGAIYAYAPAGVVDLYSCRLLGNTSVQDDGAAYILAASSRVQNCAFSGNTATRDVGVLDVSGSLRSDIVNCTFANSTAGRYNGGILSSSAGTLSNCIVWGNRDSTTNLLWQRQLAGFVAGQINNCLIEGLVASLGGAGNFGADPRFNNPLGADGVAGTLDDDLTVKRGSFAIDAGSNPLYGPRVDPLVSVDLGGQPRFVMDPGSPQIGTGPAPIVDIGAYEFQGVSCRADFNGDGRATVQDIFDFLSAFFSQNPQADFNRSGLVTVQDIFDFLAVWFRGC